MVNSDTDRGQRGEFCWTDQALCLWNCISDLAHSNHLAWTTFHQRGERGGNQREQVCQAIALGAHHDDAQAAFLYRLLHGEVSVDGDERLELQVRATNQFTVPSSSPSAIHHRPDLMPRKYGREPPVHTFIQ